MSITDQWEKPTFMLKIIAKVQPTIFHKDGRSKFFQRSFKKLSSQSQEVWSVEMENSAKIQLKFRFGVTVIRHPFVFP